MSEYSKMTLEDAKNLLKRIKKEIYRRSGMDEEGNPLLDENLRHFNLPILDAPDDSLFDIGYTDDVIRALVMVGERGKADTVYAIGHGDNWPLRNYIEMIRDRIDPSLPLGIGEVAYKEKTLPMSCIDLTNLQRDTGFIPQVSFNEGIDRVITSIKREKKLLGDKT